MSFETPVAISRNCRCEKKKQYGGSRQAALHIIIYAQVSICNFKIEDLQVLKGHTDSVFLLDFSNKVQL